MVNKLTPGETLDFLVASARDKLVFRPYSINEFEKLVADNLRILGYDVDGNYSLEKLVALTIKVADSASAVQYNAYLEKYYAIPGAQINPSLAREIASYKNSVSALKSYLLEKFGKKNVERGLFEDVAEKYLLEETGFPEFVPENDRSIACYDIIKSLKNDFAVIPNTVPDEVDRIMALLKKGYAQMQK